MKDERPFTQLTNFAIKKNDSIVLQDFQEYELSIHVF